METYVLEDASFMIILYNYFFKIKLHCADIWHKFIYVLCVRVWTVKYRHYLIWDEITV
jgi:hypothetical protein